MTRGSSSTRFSSLTRTSMPAASIADTKSDNDCCGMGIPLLRCCGDYWVTSCEDERKSNSVQVCRARRLWVNNGLVNRCAFESVLAPITAVTLRCCERQGSAKSCREQVQRISSDRLGKPT